MEYNIQAPDNVVEASYSTDPDDVSVVSVRIVATLEPATESLGDLKAIEFVVPPELTTNPSSITPQAHSFADWEMQVQGATFVASPRWPSEQSPGGSVNQPSPPDGGWVFYLRDVEIVDSPGSAEITVREVRGAQTDEKGRLKLRKIHPSLRIDYFRVIDADGEPLDASTRSTEPVTLAWATTSATSVSLWGPSIDGLGDRGGAVSDDDSVTIRPETTSVYTLVASNASSHTIAQVTVTVTDQTVADRMQAASLASGFLDLRNDTKGQASLLVMHEHHDLVDGEVDGEDLDFTLQPQGIRFKDGKPAIEPRRYLLMLRYRGETGRAYLGHDGEWHRSSDAALKERIDPLPRVLDGVRGLRPATFSWKGEDATHVGFIAQEVEEIFPHLVGTTTGADGQPERTLAYSGFGVLAIAAIQELAQESEDRIGALETRVAELTERLERQQRP